MSKETLRMLRAAWREHQRLKRAELRLMKALAKAFNG